MFALFHTPEVSGKKTYKLEIFKVVDLIIWGARDFGKIDGVIFLEVLRIGLVGHIGYIWRYESFKIDIVPVSADEPIVAFDLFGSHVDFLPLETGVVQTSVRK